MSGLALAVWLTMKTPETPPKAQPPARAIIPAVPFKSFEQLRREFEQQRRRYDRSRGNTSLGRMG